VTGHSLGAAIATHTVGYLLANKIKVTDFYNYGCPRVGDAKFTVWFNQLYGKDHFKARVTHRRDPVPHLPFEDWGFLHVNTEVFYKGSKKEGGHICNDASA
jgi:predicted lipase